MTTQCCARTKSDIFKRCTRYCIKNSDFCKLHTNNSNTIRYDTELYSVTEINNIMLSDNIKYTDINLLKYCLYINNISYKGSKKDIIKRFEKLKIKNKFFYSNINLIIKLQKHIRGFLIRNFNKLKGPGLFNYKSITNETDFYTCDNINEIKYNNLFTYKDIDNFIYAFDIRSIDLLINKNKPQNPYNRNIISSDIINNINILIKHLKHNNKYEPFEEVILTPTQKLKQYVITVFQNIDKYYHTNIDWFLNLNIEQLKQFYINLEDIWNYRAHLTPQIKYNIIQNNKLFKHLYTIIKFKYYASNNIKQKIQYFILHDIYTLTTSGITNEDCNLGALYVLTALTKVSYDCAYSMPWLTIN